MSSDKKLSKIEHYIVDTQRQIMHTYATIISPFLEKAGIALNMVESPKEYRIESGVPKNFAILASQSRWTSGQRKSIIIIREKAFLKNKL